MPLAFTHMARGASEPPTRTCSSKAMASSPSSPARVWRASRTHTQAAWSYASRRLVCGNKREATMPELEPTYISLGRWTRGWSGAGELPVTRTLSKSRWDVTIHSFYWVASGGYDTVAISSGAPLSIARCKLAISQRDQVQTELLTAVATY